MKAKYLFVTIVITIILIATSLTKIILLEKKINVLEGRVYNLENPKVKVVPAQ